MGLGFLVDQIYLVSLGNYDPHAKNLRFFCFFYLPSSIGLHFLTAGPLKNISYFNDRELVPGSYDSPMVLTSDATYRGTLHSLL